MIHQTADFDLHPVNWYASVCTCGYTNGPFPDPETMVDDLMAHASSYELEKLRDEFVRSKAKWQAEHDADGYGQTRSREALRIETLDSVIAAVNKRLTT